ncbi:hypothetical protein [Parapedobacter composti]|nr:hypothetical protein [Parapedobacter composti]
MSGPWGANLTSVATGTAITTITTACLHSELTVIGIAARRASQAQ